MKEFTEGGIKYIFCWCGLQHRALPSPGGKQSTNSQFMTFANPLQASAFLRNLPGGSGDLRLLLREKIGLEVMRYDQNQVFNQVATALCNKSLMVEQRGPNPATSNNGTASASSRSNGRSVMPRKDPSVDAFANTATAESAMFFGTHDPKDQAAVLLEASKNGAAFCEECEKARQAMAEEANVIDFSQEDSVQ